MSIFDRRIGKEDEINSLFWRSSDEVVYKKVGKDNEYLYDYLWWNTEADHREDLQEKENLIKAVRGGIVGQILSEKVWNYFWDNEVRQTTLLASTLVTSMSALVVFSTVFYAFDFAGFPLQQVLIDLLGLTDTSLNGNAPVGILAAVATYLATYQLFNVFFVKTLKGMKTIVRFITGNGIKPSIVKDADTYAEGIIDNCLRYTYDEETPEDLKDKYRLMIFDANGKPIESQFSTADYDIPYLQETVSTVFNHAYDFIVSGMKKGSLLAAVGVFSIMLGFEPLSTIAIALIINAFLIVGQFLALKARKLRRTISPLLATRKNFLSDKESKGTGRAILNAAGQTYGSDINQARLEQIANAKRDKSSFIKLGETTGALYNRKDPFAPSEAGKDFGITLDDLSVHLLVIGQTGSGKTSSALRPILHQAFSEAGKSEKYPKGVGALILDGKGVLPKELVNISDEYQLINPNTAILNPIEGLTPDEVADSFFGLYVQGKADIWDQSASKLIRSCGTILEVTGRDWTLANLYKLVASDEFLQEVLDNDEIPEEGLNGTQESRIEFRIGEFRLMADKMRESIRGTATTWLSSVVDNELLSEWSSTPNGIKVEKVCQGEKIGIGLDTATYGSAGNLISMMTKARVYKALQQRGDKWPEGDVPVLVLIDEAQELISGGSNTGAGGATSASDGTILATGRSLGAKLVLASQSIDSLHARFDKSAEAEQFLGNLLNIIAFRSDTELTAKFVSTKMGSRWIAEADKSAFYDVGGNINSISNTKGGSRGDFDRLFGQSDDKASSAQLGEMYSFKNGPIIPPDQISELLSRPNTAFVKIERGRVPRRELIRTIPIYN